MHSLAGSHQRTSTLARTSLLLAAIAAAAASGACSEKHGCCYDVVCPPPPSPLGVTVSPGSATVAVGDTARFVVLFSPGYGNPCSDDVEVKPAPSRAATWSLSNGSVGSIVATPDSNTVIVRGIAPGTSSVIAASVADVTAKGAGLLIVK